MPRGTPPWPGSADPQRPMALRARNSGWPGICSFRIGFGVTGTGVCMLLLKFWVKGMGFCRFALKASGSGHGV